MHTHAHTVCTTTHKRLGPHPPFSPLPKPNAGGRQPWRRRGGVSGSGGGAQGGPAGAGRARARGRRQQRGRRASRGRWHAAAAALPVRAPGSVIGRLAVGRPAGLVVHMGGCAGSRSVTRKRACSAVSSVLPTELCQCRWYACPCSADFMALRLQSPMLVGNCHCDRGSKAIQEQNVGLWMQAPVRIRASHAKPRLASHSSAVVLAASSPHGADAARQPSSPGLPDTRKQCIVSHTPCTHPPTKEQRGPYRAWNCATPVVARRKQTITSAPARRSQLVRGPLARLPFKAKTKCPHGVGARAATAAASSCSLAASAATNGSMPSSISPWWRSGNTVRAPRAASSTSSECSAAPQPCICLS